jgi:hypothetical protein
MTFEEAKRIVENAWFRPYFDWEPGDSIAIVDGWCSLEDLEAMLVYMRDYPSENNG